MKRIFFVTCLLTFAFMVSAQGGQGGGQRQGGQGGQGGFRQQTPEQISAQLEQMKKDLNLNDKQFADYKKIDEETRAKQQKMREDAGGDFEKMRDASVKLREEQNAKIKAALTADQYKKYEEIMAQRRQGGGQGGNRQN